MGIFFLIKQKKFCFGNILFYDFFWGEIRGILFRDFLRFYFVVLVSLGARRVPLPCDPQTLCNTPGRIQLQKPFCKLLKRQIQ